jgi:hypothetical protein
MKNIITVLSLVCTTAFFAQSTASVKGNSSSMQSNKEVGIFEIKLENAVEADVIKNASYYKDFFTVTYSPKISIVKITMVKNTPEARRVIVRFLTSLKHDSVMFDGKKISTADFYEVALK